MLGAKLLVVLYLLCVADAQYRRLPLQGPWKSKIVEDESGSDILNKFSEKPMKPPGRVLGHKIPLSISYNPSTDNMAMTTPPEFLIVYPESQNNESVSAESLSQQSDEAKPLLNDLDISSESEEDLVKIIKEPTLRGRSLFSDFPSPNSEASETLDPDTAPESESALEPESEATSELNVDTELQSEKEGETDPELAPKTVQSLESTLEYEPQDKSEIEIASEPKLISTSPLAESSEKEEKTEVPVFHSRTSSDSEPTAEFKLETESKIESEPESMSDLESESKAESKSEPELDAEPESETSASTDSNPEIGTEPNPEPESASEPDYESESEPSSPIFQSRSASDPEPETVLKANSGSDTEPVPEQETNTESESETAKEPVSKVQPELEPVPESQTETEPKPESESELEPASQPSPPIFQSRSSSDPEPDEVIDVESGPDTEQETKSESESETAAEPVSDLQTDSEPVPQPQPESESKSEPESVPESESKPESEAELEAPSQPSPPIFQSRSSSDPEPEPALEGPESESTTKEEPESKSTPDSTPESEKPETESEPEAGAEPKPEINAEPEPEAPEPDPKTKVASESIPESDIVPETKPQADPGEHITLEGKAKVPTFLSRSSSDAQNVSEPVPESEPKSETKTEPTSEAETESEAKPEPKTIPETEQESKQEKPGSEIEPKSELEPDVPIFRPRSPNFETEMELLTSPPVDGVCVEEYGYYEIPNECDTFIECKHHIAEKYICPDGLLFNPKAAWPNYPCSYPTEVECGSKVIKQIPSPVGICPHRFGTFPLNTDDCGRYLVCEDGQALIMNCPVGLAFNPTITACDWPERVPYCNLKVFEDFTCPEQLKEYGTLSEKVFKYRYKNSCNDYIACVKGLPRLLRCDSGLSFDDASGRCIASNKVTNCEGNHYFEEIRSFITHSF